MYPNRPESMFALAKANAIENISGLVPTESQLAQFVAIALSSYLTFLMIKTIRDQNNYNARRKGEDKDSKTPNKNFADIGGCE